MRNSTPACTRARLARTHAVSMTRAPAGAILMCHPANGVASDDEIGVARSQEFAYLAGEEFAAALQAAGVRVARGQVALTAA